MLYSHDVKDGCELQLLLELENVMGTEGWSCFMFTTQSPVQSENVNKALDCKEPIMPSFYHCTVHSDIHTVHSPTDAHLLKL